MKKLTALLSAILLWCFATASFAQEETNGKGLQFHQNESWEKILELAQKENKMIFMDCYTTWCGPCKALAKEIFPQEKVGEFFNPRFINVQYDMEKGDGKMLYAKYKKNIIGFPTLLLLDKEGNVLQQMAGFLSADKLIEGIKKASEGKDLFTLQKKYRQGERSFAFIQNYISCLQDAFLKDTIAAVTSDYFKNMDLKDLDKDEVWAVLGEYITNMDSPAFDYLARNADRYYYRLNRDRYKINRQLEGAVNREINRITHIRFDDNDQPKALVPDTATAKKVLQYMSIAGLKRINETKAKLFINDLLIAQNYPEAWKYVQECVKMDFTGFNSATVHDYIKYMSPSISDKKMLKNFLQTLETYEQQDPKSNSFFYHMYKTMSQLNERLGNKKLAQEQMQKFEKIDQEKRKELEKYFN